MNFFAIRNYSIAALMIASASSFSSSTVAQNKISCQSTFGLSIRCSLDQEMLKSGYKFQEEAFETEYKVKYLFNCPGDSVGFGFGLQSPSAPSPDGVVSLFSSQNEQVKYISGVGDLYLHDPNPRRTRNSSFRGSCYLAIDEVTRQPTRYTERLWSRRVEDKEDLVFSLDAAIRLTVNLDQYDTWSRAQRRLLEDQISILAEEYRVLCDIDGSFSDNCFAAEDFENLMENLQSTGPDAIGQDERRLLISEFEERLVETEQYLLNFKQFLDEVEGESL